MPTSFVALLADLNVQKQLVYGSIGDRLFSPKITAESGKSSINAIAKPLGGHGVTIAHQLT